MFLCPGGGMLLNLPAGLTDCVLDNNFRINWGQFFFVQEVECCWIYLLDSLTVLNNNSRINWGIFFFVQEVERGPTYCWLADRVGQQLQNKLRTMFLCLSRRWNAARPTCWTCWPCAGARILLTAPLLPVWSAWWPRRSSATYGTSCPWARTWAFCVGWLCPLLMCLVSVPTD